MKKLVTMAVLVFLSLAHQELFAQNTINYLEDRKNKMLASCTVNDLISVEHDLSYLLGIDPDKISTGLYDYYYDLRMIYYVKTFMYKQSKFEDDFYHSYFACIRIDSKRDEAYHSLVV